MKIESIRLSNWMNISSCFLEFQDGMNVFHGENGQGKSSVLEAIAFCLLGRTRGSSWKDYVKNGEDKFVINLSLLKTDIDSDRMEFEYEGDLVSGTTSKKIQYHSNTYIGEGANKFLEETFDLKMLENTVFSMQDGVPISTMEPAQRRDIFKKIFNSDFPEIVQNVKSDMENTKLEEAKVSSNIEIIKSYPYNYYKDIQEVNPSTLTELQKELESVKASEVVYQKFRFYLEKVNALQVLNSRMTALTSRKAIALENEGSVQSSAPILKKDKDELKIKLRASMLVLSGIEQNLEDAEKEYRTSLSNKENLENSLREPEISENIRKNHIKISEHNGNIHVLRKHLEAHRNGECENCGQKTDSTKVSNINQDMQKEQEDINLLEAQNSELKEEITKEKECIKALTSEVLSKSQILEVIRKKLSIAEKEVSSIEGDIKLKDQAILSLEDKIRSAQEKVNEVQTDIDNLNKEITELSSWCEENKVEAPPALSRNYDLIQMEIDSVLAKIQEVIAQKKFNEDLRHTEEENRKSIIELTTTLNQYQLKIKSLKEIQKIFETDFPNFINLRACTLLQGYLNTFFEGIKEKFIVKLEQSKKGIEFLYRASDEREWNVIKMLSGFEKALLTLGFKVAVSKAYGNDLILLDEPDASASEDSSERVFQSVVSLTGFRQMFIITHKIKASEFLRESGARVFEVKNGEFTLES